MVVEIRLGLCNVRVYEVSEDKVIIRIVEKEKVRYDFDDVIDGYKIIIERKE